MPEAPVEVQTIVPPSAPSDQSISPDMRESVAIFRQEQAKLEAAEPPEPLEPPAKTAESDNGKAAPKEDKKAAAPKPDDSGLPDELFGKPKEPEHKSLSAELDAVEPPANQRAVGNFKQLKELSKKHIAALEQQVAELKRKPAEPAPDTAKFQEQLKAEQDRRAALEAELERANFEASPRYKQFGAEMAQELASAKSYLEGTEINPNVLEIAARETGAKRLAILRENGVDPETIAAISPYMARIDRLGARRDVAVQDWKSTQEKWSADQQRQQQAEEERLRAEEDQVFNSTGEAVAQVFEPFRTIPGNDKWNAQVELLKTEAREFFNGSLPLEKLSEIAYYGVGAKVLHKAFHTLREKYEEQSKELAALKAAQPGTGASNGTSQRGGSDRANMSLEDRAMADFREMQRQMGA